MNRRYFLIMPMLVLIVFMMYTVVTEWDTFTPMSLGGIAIAFVVAVHFIWTQLTFKFIDFSDGFKIKDVYTNVERFQRQRRTTNYIFIAVLIIILALNYYSK